MGWLDGLAGGLVSGGLGLIGGLVSNKNNNDQADKNIQMQKEFAQNGIRWKVEDAKAAGLHPLAALGAQVTPYAPIAINDSLGPAISNAGQSIGRSIDATRTSDERRAEFDRQQNRLEIYSRLAMEGQGLDNEHKALQNQYLISQIQRLQQERLATKPLPNSLVRPDAKRYGSVKYTPSEVVSANPDVPSLEAGPPNPTFKTFRFGSGPLSFKYDLPSQTASEGFDAVGPLGWALTAGHNAVRSFDKVVNGGSPPKWKLPPNHEWKWSVLDQSWYPAPKRDSRIRDAINKGLGGVAYKLPY